MFKKFLKVVYIALTILVGAALLFVACYPKSVSFIGLAATDSYSFGVRLFFATVFWFIFGSDVVTKKVAEFEKSGALTLIATGIFVAIIFEGSKLVEILERAGFKTQDVVFLLGGIIFLIVGLVWGNRKLKESAALNQLKKRGKNVPPKLS